jgi:hypothetical protein
LILFQSLNKSTGLWGKNIHHKRFDRRRLSQAQRSKSRAHAKTLNLRGKTSPAGEEEKTMGNLGFHYEK